MKGAAGSTSGTGRSGIPAGNIVGLTVAEFMPWFLRGWFP